MMYGFSPAWQLVHMPPAAIDSSAPPAWYRPDGSTPRSGTPMGIWVPAGNEKVEPPIWLSQKHTFEVVLLKQITPSRSTFVSVLSAYRGRATHMPSLFSK